MNGDFITWDPKITTFPGLYYFSYLFSKPLEIVGILNEGPTKEFCRTLNFLTSFLIPFIISKYRMLLFPQNNSVRDLVSIIIYLFPFSAFYYNLYYTDTLSLVFVLLTLYTSFQMFQVGVLSVKSKKYLRSHLQLLLVSFVFILFSLINKMINRLVVDAY
jgi:alpha-1,2-glucosyltransferase